jgi:hypothetical protein
MTFDFYETLKSSYGFENPVQAGKSMREVGAYIASGRATIKECAEGIDCLILAACSGNGNLSWGASDGFQQIFMADGLNGADLIDQFLETSQILKSLENSQRQSLAYMLQEATNLYMSNHRELPNPRLDNFQGHIFDVSFDRCASRRKLFLKL